MMQLFMDAFCLFIIADIISKHKDAILQKVRLKTKENAKINLAFSDSGTLRFGYRNILLNSIV
jgi:hypothetical protein